LCAATSREGSDGAEFAACWKKLKVTIVGPENFEKNFAARGKNQGVFDAIVVGAWQVQRVTPVLGATAKQPSNTGSGAGAGSRGGGVMVLEGAKYFVFMDKKASTQFAVKSSLLADAAGFAPVPAAAEAEAAAEEAPGHLPSLADDDENKKAPHPVGPGILPDVDDVHRFFVVKPAAAA
jgi:dynein assembly factor 3